MCFPPTYRDPDRIAEAPAASFDLEWLYGYRGRDLKVASNLHLLPRTGELAYFCASVVVLYNGEAQTQRHYRNHTNDVECLAVHQVSYNRTTERRELNALGVEKD